MSVPKPTFSDKELFTTAILGLPDHIDSYFEACNTLKRQTELFLRNAASSTLPSEVVELEDVKAAGREVSNQGDAFVEVLKKLGDMVEQNDRWFVARMEEVEQVERERER